MTLDTITEFYEEILTLNAVYTVNADGQKEGTYESYHRNGQLFVKCTYKDGQLDGPFEKYFCSGQLWVKCTYKNGKEDGLFEKYYDDGLLWVKCTYKDGQLDGPFEQYSLYFGSKKCTYKDGQFDGLYEEYDNKGNLCVKCTYKNGKKIVPERETKERLVIVAKLDAINKQMKPTQLRQNAKRALVAKYQKEKGDRG